MKRFIVIAATVVATLGLLGSLAAWFLLSSWVPTKGRALVIQEIERRWPVEVSIGAMRYDPLRGLRLERVDVVHRATRQPQLAAPELRIGIKWMPLVLQRTVAFRAQGALERPYRIDLTLAGHYHLKDRALTLEARTPELSLDAVPGPIRNLEGRAHVTPERIRIDRLTGTALGSRWTLEGEATPGTPLRAEWLVESTVDLPSVAAAVPALAGRWQATGEMLLRASCRGVFASPPVLDCVSEEALRRVTVTGPALPAPLTAVSGRLAYDLLTRHLAIDSLEGHLADKPFTLAGRLRLVKPFPCSLRIRGVVPVELIREWLPSPQPVSRLGGTATATLQIAGSLSDPQLSGTVELEEVEAVVEAPAMTVQHASGTVRFSENRVSIEHLTLRVNDQPLVLSAQVSPPPQGGWLSPRNRPGVSATIRLPQGEVAFEGRLMPTRLVIEEAVLTLPASTVHVSGYVGRGAEPYSELRLGGTVELSELGALPFVSIPAVNAWQLKGRADLDLSFAGRPAVWRDAIIRGRLMADRLTIRDIPLQQATCAIEQSNGVLRLRIPSAYVAEGKFWGELAVQHRRDTHDFLAQADISGLQLARLAQVIPAWRSRSVSGLASAHTLLSGTWEHRPTWLGEGWINGSGERLGDLPLLDTVFRGLFGLLGERLGLESLRRAEITEASLNWRLAQERFRTEDLRLGGLAGAEPIAVYAKGSVGFDQTLDFTIEPELSEGVVLEAPTTSTLARTVLKAAGQLERFRRLIGRHRLTGTIKDPHYQFEFSPQDVLKQLAPGPLDLLQNLFGR